MTALEKKQAEFIEYLLRHSGTSIRIENFQSEISKLKAGQKEESETRINKPDSPEFFLKKKISIKKIYFTTKQFNAIVEFIKEYKNL